MNITIIPATYNERENIGKLITIMEVEVFPKINNHKMSILVADDYSPDGTAEEVRLHMKKWKNLDINLGEKKGLGAAYIRSMNYAIKESDADVVLSIDADFQFNPHDIPKFIKKIEEGYDMVVQTRYSDGGSIPKNWPIQRKLFSVVANNFVRIVFGIYNQHDWTGGFRAIKKEAYLSIAPTMKGYDGYIFQIAFLHKAIRAGFKITEVPVHFSDRKLGNSKIAPLDYILDILKYVIFTRLAELGRFIKFLFVGGTGFMIQLFTQEISVILGTTNLIAVAIGAESAIISNFLLNNFWTFSDTGKLKERGSILQRLLRFNFASFGAILIQFISYYLAEIVFGSEILFFDYKLPTRIVILIPVIVFLVIPLNYFIYNRLIWRTDKLK